MCDSIHSPKFGSVEAFLEEDVPLKMMEQSVGPSLEEIEYWRGVDQTANAMMTTTTPDSKERRSVTEEMEVESRLERHKQKPRQRKRGGVSVHHQQRTLLRMSRRERIGDALSLSPSFVANHVHTLCL